VSARHAWVGEVVGISLNAVAFVLCSSALAPGVGWLRLVVFGVDFGLAAWWWERRRPSHLAMRVARGVAFGAVVACRLLFVLEAVALAMLVGWSVPAPFLVLAAAAAVGAASTVRRRTQGVRVPAMLAVGIFVAGCWRGWDRAEGSVACAERAAVLSQPGIELVASTLPDGCTGARMAFGRLPQKLLEAPDGRLFFTTKQVSASASPFGGSICEARGTARCVGRGSGYGLALDAGAERLYAPVRGRFEDALSVVYAVSTRDGLDIRRTLPMRVAATELFVDPTAMEAGFFADARDDVGGWVPRVRLPDFRPLPLQRVLSVPADVRYDARMHRGLVCSATAAVDGPFPLTIGSVFTAEPFSVRGIGSSPLALFSWWGGCDWDAARRTAYAAVPGLGLIAEIDLQTGAVRRTHFVGIGARVVLLDEARRRLVVGNYFSGETRAFDLETFGEAARWSVGRLLGDLVLTRDGRSLLAASRVGIVRVPLD